MTPVPQQVFAMSQPHFWAISISYLIESLPQTWRESSGLEQKGWSDPPGCAWSVADLPRVTLGKLLSLIVCILRHSDNNTYPKGTKLWVTFIRPVCVAQPSMVPIGWRVPLERTTPASLHPLFSEPGWTPEQKCSGVLVPCLALTICASGGR